MYYIHLCSNYSNLCLSDIVPIMLIVPCLIYFDLHLELQRHILFFSYVYAYVYVCETSELAYVAPVTTHE